MLYMVVWQAPHSDSDVSIFRTPESANEKFDSLIVEAVQEDDRTVVLYLWIVHDEFPDQELNIGNREPGCREWFAQWPDHWKAGQELVPVPEPDPEDRPRFHSDCGFVHGPDDCER